MFVYFIMFVYSNVDVVISAVATFLNSTSSRLCLLHSSLLTGRFTVCPIKISHLYDISDGKKVYI